MFTRTVQAKKAQRIEKPVEAYDLVSGEDHVNSLSLISLLRQSLFLVVQQQRHQKAKASLSTSHHSLKRLSEDINNRKF